MKTDKSENTIFDGRLDQKDKHDFMVRQVIPNSVKPLGAPWVTLNEQGRVRATYKKNPFSFLGTHSGDPFSRTHCRT